MNSLIEYYKEVRALTEEYCVPLQTEDYTPQSVVFASPPKWHLGHTTWFFEEMILKSTLEGYKVFDESYNYLFNSYYNSIGERIERDERGLITRPSIDTVYEYRKYVDRHICELIEAGIDHDTTELIVLGLNHEQQHQELVLTDLKYTFSKNPTYPVYKNEALVNGQNTSNNWVKVEEGIYEIGHNGEEFSYDNESGKHKVYLESFEISNSLVTNGEFMGFIESGGYKDHSVWLDEGWAWVNDNNIQQPLYWHNVNGEWFHYTLSGLQKIDHQSILSHISFYEAQAFATWKGMRLPTEFEWEAASNHIGWGQRWEWTNSAYLPYPRFAVKEGAVGEYNGKFMINQMVLRGASVATSPNHSRSTYRNFFHPQMQWQFSGIRLVK